MDDVAVVLAKYGVPFEHCDATPITSGFSGAGVWKIVYQHKLYALKRWPKGIPSYHALHFIHADMRVARTAGLSFVPDVMINRDGSSVTDYAGLQWEVSTWQNGDPAEAPEKDALHAAVQALARLHALWRPRTPQRAACPGITTRYQKLLAWASHESLERLKFEVKSNPLYQRAFHHFDSGRDRARRRLEPWVDRSFPLWLCLGDVWSDHVLFQGTTVTGIIDFGGMRYDHPAQDLARLLGSYRLSPRQVAAGLEAYPGRTTELDDLVRTLIETGRIVALGNWLWWLVIERRPFSNLDAAHRRLARLVEEAESNPH